MSAAEIRRASTTGGIALLVLAVLAAFGHVGVVDRLIVEDDAVRTAADIADSETLFRLGLASLLVAAVLDIVVAWALFKVFEPVSSGLSMLTAWFRLAYAGIFVVAIAQLAGVLRLLPEVDTAGGDIAAQVLSGAHAYDDIWHAGLVLFGVHLLLLAVLIYRTVYAPTILGILLFIGGLSYLIDGFGDLLFAGYDVELATFTFLGELVLIFWLLLRGRRITPSALSRTEHP